MNTRRRRKRQQFQATIILTAAAILLFILIFFQLSKSTVIGSKDIEVTYLSVEVSEDDTLWDLANEFVSEDYYEINDYIETIININGLKSETIYPGQRLTLPVCKSKVSI